MQPWPSSEISQLLCKSHTFSPSLGIPRDDTPGVTLQAGRDGRISSTPSSTLSLSLSQSQSMPSVILQGDQEGLELFLPPFTDTVHEEAAPCFWHILQGCQEIGTQNPWSICTSTKRKLNSIHSRSRGGNYFSFRGNQSSACSFPLLW